MFADGKSAYGWETCFHSLDGRHQSDIFSADRTAGYGIAVKKGVIYEEFEKLTVAIRDARRADAQRNQVLHKNN